MHGGIALHIYLEQPALAEVSDSGGDGQYAIHQQTQAGLIKSRFVLMVALRELRAAPLNLNDKHGDLLTLLEEELKVEPQDTSEMLRISLSGDDPAALAALVNAVTDAYLREVVNNERDKRKEHHDRLERSRNTVKRTLRAPDESSCTN